MIRKLAILGLIFVLAGCSQSGGNATPTVSLAGKCPDPTSSVPVHIVLYADNAPAKGGSTVVTWGVCADLDQSSVHGFLELPEGVSLVGGTGDWQGSLKAGGYQQLSATLQINTEGQVDIRGVVQAPQASGDMWSAVNHLYFTISAEGSKIGLPSGSDDSGAIQVP